MSIQIQTTQNVILDMRAAGIGTRILAYILDWIFIIIWIIAAAFVLGDIAGGATSETWFMLIVFIPAIFYDLLFEYFGNGQSLGKKIMKIKVVNLDGTTPSFGAYLLRWLFRLVDFSLTSGSLSVVMVALTDKSQRLGDLLAGTTVISLKAEGNSAGLSIPDLDFHENYAVVYDDVLSKLNDKDINTIRMVLDDYRYSADTETIGYLVNKVKDTTGYTYDGNNRAFLKKIIDDYNYLSIQ